MAATTRMTRERRTLLIISALVAIIVLLTILETYLQGLELSSRFITNNIIVFAVVNLHIVLLMILVILVLRNLVKLYFEHRQRILGSRFKAKLIIAFTALSIIPSFVLFIGSFNLINKSIRNWFDKSVEEVLSGTAEVSQVYYRNLGTTALHFARNLARLTEEAGGVEAAAEGSLTAILAEKRREYGFASIRIFDARSNEVLLVTAVSSLPRALTSDVAKTVRQAVQGLEGTSIEPAGETDVVSGVVPLTRKGGAGDLEGALMASIELPASLMTKVEGITSTYESYRQSKILKNPIRISYQMTLVMMTLLIVFSATWFAFYLARTITVPIQELADGTRRISEGDLDFRIDLESDDELGMLIDSFNRMTAELKAGRLKLERAYRRLEKSNLESEQRKLYIETVLDNIATGVISLDAQKRVSTINKAAQSMLGIEGGTARNRPAAAVFSLRPYAGIEAFIEDLVTRRINWLERKVDLEREGATLNLVLIGSNLFDEKGDFSGTVVVLENMTELISAQRIAAWREAARRIAHEIKNPLTPIKLSAQRLRKKFFQGSDDFEGVFDEGTEMIITQVDELRRLVDEFSRFARMPSSKRVPCDVHAVLDNTLKLYRETYKQMTFETRFQQSPVKAMLDPEQMKRAFVNLIDNSIEATGGAGTVQVETLLDERSGNIRITVRDDGRGIPAEIRDKLFTPYFSTKKEGTGLGLSIVSSIVTDHGGHIRVRENHPRGAMFIIEIPTLQTDRVEA